MNTKKEIALTAREIEILRLIYRGKSNTEIGMILGINALTVKDHVQKILRKLEALNRTQAVGKAFALGILVPEVAPLSSSFHPSTMHS
jgi:DNA-binding CsgD family transcriptional regulator